MKISREFGVQRMVGFQVGFSLIEIMVALVLGLFLMGGVIQIFFGSKASYNTTENLSRVQENGRLAIELLSRDLRMAGYKGCLRSSMPLLNVLNNSSAFNWNFGQEIKGFNAKKSGATWTWSPTLDSDISSLQMVGGTDVITLRTIDSEGVYVTGQPSSSGDCKGSSFSSSADLKVTENTFLADDDIVLTTNCERAVVFQITNFNSKSNVVHNTGGTSAPGNSTKDLGGCLIDGEMMKISTKTYFIRTGANGRPALWRRVATNNAEELVEGVENMQITYGVDTNNDRNADTYTTADAVETGNNWSDVVSVRISLLLQSMDDKIATKEQIYEYNDETSDKASDSSKPSIKTATDRRLRQVFSSLISVRNRLP